MTWGEWEWGLEEFGEDGAEADLGKGILRRKYDGRDIGRPPCRLEKPGLRDMLPMAMIRN